MGYHFKHVIDVDLMTRNIKTHIKIKGKNTIFIIENLIKISLKKKPKNILKKIRIKYMLKINWIESHANVVVPQEEIKFPNIKNLHVIKNLWKRKIN
jgi:hypothetical protein